MRRTLNRIIIIVLSLWLLVVGVGPSLVLAATITIFSISPTTGPPGTTVTVTANNTSFTANETVTITYDVTTQSWTTTANPAGGLSSAITVPPSVAGVHTITATGATSYNSGSANFTVTPSVSVSPSGGVVGSSVTVNGIGFGNGETGTVTYDGASVGSSF